jgi:hypothetical protein
LAADYFVAPDGKDTNKGTIDAPLYSIGQDGAMRWDRAKPGDVIQVRGGTYRYSKGQWLGTSGTASARITVQAYGSERPIIDGSGMGASDHAVAIGGSYQTFRGLEVANGKAGGILVWKAHHVEIRDCEVRHSWGGSIGLVAEDRSENSEIYDVVVDNCDIHHSAQSNVAHNQNPIPGTLVALGGRRITFSNNRIYKNHGEGLIFANTWDGLAVGNVVYDSYSIGIYLDGARRARIERNLVYNTGDTAHYLSGRPMHGIASANEGNDSTRLTTNTFVNNVVVGAYTGYYYGDWMGGGGLHDDLFAHNTIWGTTGPALLVDPSSRTAHTNTVFANNVFHSAGKSIDNVQSLVGLSLHHNCWANAPAKAGGSGDVVGSPELTNPGTFVALDYQVRQSSPCRDAGAALSAVTNDFTGGARPVGSLPDMGAFELGSTPSSTGGQPGAGGTGGSSTGGQPGAGGTSGSSTGGTTGTDDPGETGSGGVGAGNTGSGTGAGSSDDPTGIDEGAYSDYSSTEAGCACRSGRRVPAGQDGAPSLLLLLLLVACGARRASKEAS